MKEQLVNLKENLRKEIIRRIELGEFDELYPILVNIHGLSKEEENTVVYAWIQNHLYNHFLLYRGCLSFDNLELVKVADQYMKEHIVGLKR